MFTERDAFWMQKALNLADLAALSGEVPVGAVLVRDDVLVAEGYNHPIGTFDPTAHAEVRALRAGGQILSNYRLVNTTLYVTLEPCLMCAGAMVHARIGRLVYGAWDKKAGAVVSTAAVLDEPFLNHKVVHQGGLLAEACGDKLSWFFEMRRSAKKTIPSSS